MGWGEHSTQFFWEFSGAQSPESALPTSPRFAVIHPRAAFLRMKTPHIRIQSLLPNKKQGSSVTQTKGTQGLTFALQGEWGLWGRGTVLPRILLHRAMATYHCLPEKCLFISRVRICDFHLKWTWGRKGAQYLKLNTPFLHFLLLVGTSLTGTLIFCMNKWMAGDTHNTFMGIVPCEQY